MHPAHSVSSNISAANRRHNLHPFPVRQPAQSSNAAQFAAYRRSPRGDRICINSTVSWTQQPQRARTFGPTFFGLPNALRRAIAQNVCQVRAYYARSGRRQALASQLPANLWKQLEGLVSCDIADLMWRGSSSFPMTVGQRTPSPVPILGGQVAAVVHRYRPYSFPRPHLH